MARLYLVRHGTHDLVGKVLAGRMPGVPLSDDGQAQAEALARFFAASPEAVAAVASSPVQRCRDTAAPIAVALGLPVTVSDALDELDCGRWTGQSFEALEGDPAWHDWNSDRARAAIPGGETAEAVRARVMPLLDAVATEDRGPSVMVTHSDVIKVALLSVLGAPLDRQDSLEIEPASVTTLDIWPGGGRLLRSNQRVPA